ncbi:Uncharacterized protein FKW44_001218, partial [Caligus rogercresseyi]
PQHQATLPPKKGVSPIAPPRRNSRKCSLPDSNRLTRSSTLPRKGSIPLAGRPLPPPPTMTKIMSWTAHFPIGTHSFHLPSRLQSQLQPAFTYHDDGRQFKPPSPNAATESKTSSTSTTISIRIRGRSRPAGY